MHQGADRQQRAHVARDARLLPEGPPHVPPRVPPCWQHHRTKICLRGNLNRYMIYGAGSIENRGVLKPDNLMSKISLWWSCMCGADMSMDVISVLQQMVRSGLYFPTMTWIQPVGSAGLNQTRLGVLFKVIKDWKSTTKSDYFHAQRPQVHRQISLLKNVHHISRSVSSTIYSLASGPSGPSGS